MRTRDALLAHLWRTVIDAQADEASVRCAILHSKAHPGAPFTRAGSVMERLLAAGVSIQDICTIRRDSAYSAVFATLYALDDPGVEGDDVFMLHESLLSTDPSGHDGR